MSIEINPASEPRLDDATVSDVRAELRVQRVELGAAILALDRKIDVHAARTETAFIALDAKIDAQAERTAAAIAAQAGKAALAIAELEGRAGVAREALRGDLGVAMERLRSEMRIWFVVLLAVVVVLNRDAVDALGGLLLRLLH